MKAAYSNSFDVLADARDDQEQEARRERADALRQTPAFMQAVNDDEQEFDGSHWSSIGRLARERDHALHQAIARQARIADMIARDRAEEDRRRAERNRQEIEGIFHRFEIGQEARLNFLAWRAVQSPAA